MGVRFCFRYALRATLQQNPTPSTSTSQGVGQNKPPKWAKPICQTHLIRDMSHARAVAYTHDVLVSHEPQLLKPATV